VTAEVLGEIEPGVGKKAYPFRIPETGNAEEGAGVEWEPHDRLGHRQPEEAVATSDGAKEGAVQGVVLRVPPVVALPRPAKDVEEE
jgi:hypothetical protein